MNDQCAMCRDCTDASRKREDFPLLGYPIAQEAIILSTLGREAMRSFGVS